jgi:flagellar hook-basal body complex protein FliE
MSIPAVGPAQFTPFVPPAVPDVSATDPTQGAAGVAGAGGADFGQFLAQGLQRFEGLQDQTSQLAVSAATGDLNAIHDYTITATEAAVATQLTTAVRNKALEAFQSIMQMPI